MEQLKKQPHPPFFLFSTDSTPQALCTQNHLLHICVFIKRNNRSTTASYVSSSIMTAFLHSSAPSRYGPPIQCTVLIHTMSSSISSIAAHTINMTAQI